jgi:hypothetical protein
LQAEAIATEDASAERLLESNAKLNACGRAEEPVAMDKVFMPSGDFDRDDMPRNASGESDLAGGANRPVLGHEERATTGNAPDGPEETPASRMLGMCSHLDRGGHPGKLACLVDHGIVRAKGKFEDGHCGADNAMLHVLSFV